MNESYEVEAIALEQCLREAIEKFVVKHPTASPKAYIFAIIRIARMLDDFMHNKNKPQERFSHVLLDCLDISIKSRS